MKEKKKTSTRFISVSNVWQGAGTQMRENIKTHPHTNTHFSTTTNKRRGRKKKKKGNIYKAFIHF